MRARVGPCVRLYTCTRENIDSAASAARSLVRPPARLCSGPVRSTWLGYLTYLHSNPHSRVLPRGHAQVAGLGCLCRVPLATFRRCVGFAKETRVRDFQSRSSTSSRTTVPLLTSVREERLDDSVAISLHVIISTLTFLFPPEIELSVELSARYLKAIATMNIKRPECFDIIAGE